MTSPVLRPSGRTPKKVEKREVSAAETGKRQYAVVLKQIEVTGAKAVSPFIVISNVRYDLTPEPIALIDASSKKISIGRKIYLPLQNDGKRTSYQIGFIEPGKIYSDVLFTGELMLPQKTDGTTSWLTVDLHHKDGHQKAIVSLEQTAEDINGSEQDVRAKEDSLFLEQTTEQIKNDIQKLVAYSPETVNYDEAKMIAEYNYEVIARLKNRIKTQKQNRDYQSLLASFNQKLDQLKGKTLVTKGWVDQKTPAIPRCEELYLPE